MDFSAITSPLSGGGTAIAGGILLVSGILVLVNLAVIGVHFLNGEVDAEAREASDRALSR